MKFIKKILWVLFLIAIVFGVRAVIQGAADSLLSHDPTGPAVGNPVAANISGDYGEPRVEFPAENLLWGFGQLTESEQQLYMAMRDAAAAYYTGSIDCFTTIDELNRALEALDCDHPEIFWFDGELSYYESASSGIINRIDLTYCVEESLIPGYQAVIEAYISSCLSDPAVSGAQSDFDRVLGVYNYIVEHTDYDESYTEQQSVLTLMTEGKAVCAGYADSFAMIMHRLGMPCAIISGLSAQDWVLSTEGHAWNTVMVEGQWYNVDVTWGDPVWQEGSDTSAPADAYILVNDRLFDMDHSDFNKLGSPECTAMDYNFHNYYGLLHSVWDESYFRWAVQAQLDLGLDWAQVRYDNYEAYDQAKAALIDGELLGDIVMDMGFGKDEGDYISWRYNYDDTTCVFLVKLKY